jgi:spermidine/putrescine transport system substrate-binding protein
MNDVREVLGAGLRSLGYSYNSTDPAHLRAAYEHLVNLKPALANFTTDGWRDLILAGDLEVAMGYSFDALSVSDENPDLEYVVPMSGSSLWTDTMVIPRNAPNVQGAYAWINFMFQPRVAADLIERLYFATPNRAAYNLLSQELRENPTLFPPESVLERCQGILPLGTEMEKKYARYWIRLKSV